MHRISTFRAAQLVGAFVLLIVAAGCSNVRSHGHPDFALRSGETFAWTEDLESSPSADDLPWEEFRGAIAAELEVRGLRASEVEVADVLVSAALALEIVTQQNDPNFDLYVAEKYERATLSIALTRASDPGIRWQGSRRERLRYVARTMGGLIGAKWVPVDEERRWALPEVVGSIFALLGDSESVHRDR